MSAMVQTLPITRNLLTGSEWPPSELRELYQQSVEVKIHPERYRTALAGRSLVMIFEKASLRTRVTFEVGIRSLGGDAIFLDHTRSRLGEREEIRDVARNLERWVQAVIARTFRHEALEELAQHAAIPVINALSDRFHPCQALADFFTLEERLGTLRALEMAYVGDGNNVCHSLMLAAARLGVHFRVAAPAGYEPDATILAAARKAARETGSP
jgi:ornithine carbamoyltransferase